MRNVKTAKKKTMTKASYQFDARLKKLGSEIRQHAGDAAAKLKTRGDVELMLFGCVHFLKYMDC